MAQSVAEVSEELREVRAVQSDATSRESEQRACIRRLSSSVVAMAEHVRVVDDNRRLEAQLEDARRNGAIVLGELTTCQARLQHFEKLSQDTGPSSGPALSALQHQLDDANEALALESALVRQLRAEVADLRSAASGVHAEAVRHIEEATAELRAQLQAANKVCVRECASVCVAGSCDWKPFVWRMCCRNGMRRFLVWWH